MKQLFSFLLLLACIAPTFCMEKTTTLLREIRVSFDATEQVLKSTAEPKAMDAKDRQAAVQHLMRLQEVSKKLCIILNDQDGWITERSEK